MNTTNLVPVFSGELNGQSVLLVNARDLYSFLSVSTPFDKWITRRIDEYSFEEGKDFSTKLSKSRGRPRTDYHVTLDTAKELAMVERNEKGRQARRYFIECERKAHEQAAQSQTKALPAPADELPKELRAAVIRKAQALAMEGFDRIRARLEQRLRDQARYRKPEELLQWLDQFGGPDAELVVLSAHELWGVTSSVAVANIGIAAALAAVHELEAKTGRLWHGRSKEN